MKRERIAPGPGQESVWDYPRPPRLEPTSKHIEIYFNGEKIADTKRALRMLETSHPPVYYIHPDDIRREFLTPYNRRTWCEWKGEANYFNVEVNDRKAEGVAWYYPHPVKRYADLANHVAFYPSRMEKCLVDGEVVEAQPGDFYGGWITSDIVGPFKGTPGTMGW